MREDCLSQIEHQTRMHTTFWRMIYNLNAQEPLSLYMAPGAPCSRKQSVTQIATHLVRAFAQHSEHRLEHTGRTFTAQALPFQSTCMVIAAFLMSLRSASPISFHS